MATKQNADYARLVERWDFYLNSGFFCCELNFVNDCLMRHHFSYLHSEMRQFSLVAMWYGYTLQCECHSDIDGVLVSVHRMGDLKEGHTELINIVFGCYFHIEELKTTDKVYKRTAFLLRLKSPEELGIDPRFFKLKELEKLRMVQEEQEKLRIERQTSKTRKRKGGLNAKPLKIKWE